MFRFRILLLTLFLILGTLYKSTAQNGVRAFGIQFKPIFPLGLVNTDGQTITDSKNNTSLEISNGGGYSLGAVIRIGLSKRWSLETGINYVRRNYDFSVTGDDFKSSNASVRFTGYELPVVAMVFVQLGEQMYMNASGGVTFDFFPTGGLSSYDRDTIEYGMLETSWIIPALTTNLGFEYRTQEHGYFYIGATYHLPTSDMANVYISYRTPGENKFTPLIAPPPGVSGTYFTLDLRYFFNPGMKEKREKGR